MNGFWTIQQVFAFTITAAAAVGISWKFIRQLIKQSNITHNKIDAIEKLLTQVESKGMTAGAEEALMRLEQKILLTQAQVRLVMEIDGTGYVETDKDGGLIYCNTQFVKWTGLSEEEARGYGWAAAIHPDDRARVVKDWSSAVKDQRPLDLWYRYQYKNEIVSVHARSVVVRDDYKENKVLGFVAIIVPFNNNPTNATLS